MDRKFTTIYGGEPVTFRIPEANLECVLEPHYEMGTPIADPAQRLLELLENPIGCDKLVDLVKPGDTVTLVSSEYMRMPYTWILAPVVVDLLQKECGIRDVDITLMNAPGTHQNEEEQQANPLVKKLFGPLYGQHTLVMHDCDKKEDMRYMGMTTQGTPVFVNKAVADADVIIGFGELSPHHSAGHCGGGKIINPGCVARPTLGGMHRRVMTQRVDGGTHDEWQAGYWGNDRANEVRRDIEDTAAVAGLDFKIDTVTLGPDRKLVGLYAGDFVAEYREGVKQCHQLYGTATRKADISILLSGERGTYMTALMLMPYLDQATKADGIQIYVVSGESGYRRPSTRPASAMVHGKHIAYNSHWMRMNSSELAWRMTGYLDATTNLRDVSLMWQDKITFETRTCYLVTLYPNRSLMSAWGFDYITPSIDMALAKAFEEKGKDATVTVCRGYGWTKGYYMPP